ncbi:hypothetical protein G163CM_38450 [Pseudocitrobacter corydidari]|uniref:Uncharacterized protein n=1 Tax=Pseudocitrobacter corydidari TaxID=2891570 RepID=A0ABY3S9F3_9ENTR|nr:hypothetical protein G163CM_38450 [Pseudocitrobacter corydidari]
MRWRGLPDGGYTLSGLREHTSVNECCRMAKVVNEFVGRISAAPSGISLHRSSLALAKQPQQRLNLLIQRGEILFHNQMQRRGATRAVVER